MKTNLTTDRELCFNSEKIETLSFTKTCPAGTHSIEKPTIINIFDKVNVKCGCVYGSVVNGGCEN